MPASRAKQLIIDNLNKPLSFHINNLNNNNNNNINYSENQIKYLLSKIRDETFLTDNEFIKNPFKLFSKISNEKEEIPFCFCNNYIYDFIKLKIENYMIFTSPFQIRLLAQSTQIFIDATFRVCPHQFYQLLIIHSFDNVSFLYIPCVFILMTSKSKFIYENIFKEIKKIFIEQVFQ